MLKKVLLLICVLVLNHTLRAQTPQLVFAHSFTNEVDNGWYEGIYAIDWYDDTLVVSGTLKDSCNIAIQGDDIYLNGGGALDVGISVFYNENMELVDSVQLGMSITGFSRVANNKYYMGTFIGPQDFDLTGSNPYVVDTLGHFYNFFASYSSNNELNWVRYGGFQARSFCQAWNKTIAVGEYDWQNEFYGLQDTLTLFEGPNWNAYALCINEEGEIPEYYILPNSTYERFHSCDYSNQLNEIAIGGNLSGPANFQWQGMEEELTEYSGLLPVVLTYNQDLGLTHAITIEIQNGDFSGNHPILKYDEDGNLYFGVPMNSGDYVLRIDDQEFDFSVWSSDTFVMFKLDRQKNFLWMKKIDMSIGWGMFRRFEIDHNGFLNVCGFFNQVLGFIGEPVTLYGENYSGFIARWTPEGDLVWAYTINDGGGNGIYDMCITPNNEMYIGGDFSSNSTDFDLTTGGSFDLGTVTGGRDAFLAKYTIADPTPDVFIEQDWHNTAVTEDGATDIIYIRLSHPPASAVQVTATPDSQLDLGNGQGVPVILNFTPDATAIQQQMIDVSSYNDIVLENLHVGIITFSVTSADPQFNNLSEDAITVTIQDNDYTGIEETEAFSFSLSPNPATNEVVLSFAHHQNNTTIHVFDETGKLVLTEQATGTQHRMPIAEIAAGTYTVSIAAGNQKLTKVFMKR
jgi:hypothetical protein